MSGKQIRASLDEMLMACDKIDERSCCDRCPLFLKCIKEETCEEIWNSVSEAMIDDFFGLADHLEEILEGEAKEEQKEYNEWIDELNRGYYRDRGL